MLPFLASNKDGLHPLIHLSPLYDEVCMAARLAATTDHFEDFVCFDGVLRTVTCIVIVDE